MFFRKKQSKEKWIIVGLGNFGPEYNGTRHNCGFDVIDILAETYGIEMTKKKFKGILGEGVIEDRAVVLVKPTTYMNASGECVGQVLRWYKQEEDRLIVIYDDIDIAPGQIRVRAQGSAGSHNGMKSVLQYTGSDVFVRIRIGIGKNPPAMDLAAYVLGRFTKEEQALADGGKQRGAEAVASVLRVGCERTMSAFNRGGKE